jgi:hypothetical protein
MTLNFVGAITTLMALQVGRVGGRVGGWVGLQQEPWLVQNTPESLLASRCIRVPSLQRAVCTCLLSRAL